MKNKTLIIAGIVAVALLSALIGALVGGMTASSWSEPEPGDTASQTPICATSPELNEALANLRAGSDAIKEELALLRAHGDSVETKIEALAGDTAETVSAAGLRDSLPLAYVYKVDEFFESASPLTLLSAKAARDRTTIFGRPIFIAHDLITVPYNFSDQYHYLIVQITILDYYDLQFDVLWDSLEGQGR